MEDTYIYSPLNFTKKQLRLVTLLPGSRGTPIECELAAPSLIRQSLQCEALSYEWGSPNGPKMEIVLQKTRFEVRDNLWLALHCLRSESESRQLWIDAICINQNDTSERNHQVGLMGDIYRNASRVMVWLDREGDSSGPAFALLERLWVTVGRFGHDDDQKKLREKASLDSTFIYSQDSDVLEDIQELTSIWYNFEGYEEHMACREDAVQNMLALFYRDDEAWEALAQICSRRYWTRIWIVQEVVLAQEVTFHCGWDSIDGTVRWETNSGVKVTCIDRQLDI